MSDLIVIPCNNVKAERDGRHSWMDSFSIWYSVLSGRTLALTRIRATRNRFVIITIGRWS